MTPESQRRSFLRLSKKSTLRVRKLAYAEKVEEQVSEYQEIGGGGLCFLSRKAYDVGTLLRIEADVPGWHQDSGRFGGICDQDGRHLVAVAEVVRVESGPAGRWPTALRFENVYETDRRALLAYLNRMVGDNADYQTRSESRTIMGTNG